MNGKRGRRGRNKGPCTNPECGGSLIERYPYDGWYHCSGCGQSISAKWIKEELDESRKPKKDLLARIPKKRSSS